MINYILTFVLIDDYRVSNPPLTPKPYSLK